LRGTASMRVYNSSRGVQKGALRGEAFSFERGIDAMIRFNPSSLGRKAAKKPVPLPEKEDIVNHGQPKNITASGKKKRQG